LGAPASSCFNLIRALEARGYLLLPAAGDCGQRDHTRNTTSGGVQAFIDNPRQWDLLKENSMLLRSAVEEILRWVSPVIQFVRTAS